MTLIPFSSFTLHVPIFLIRVFNFWSYQLAQVRNFIHKTILKIKIQNLLHKFDSQPSRQQTIQFLSTSSLSSLIV